MPKSSVYINGSNTNSTMEYESGELMLSPNMIGAVVTTAILFIWWIIFVFDGVPLQKIVYKEAFFAI